MRSRIAIVGLAAVAIAASVLFVVTRGPGGDTVEFQIPAESASDIQLGSGVRLIIPADSVDRPGQLRVTRLTSIPAEATLRDELPFERLLGPFQFDLIEANLTGEAFLEVPVSGLGLPAGVSPEVAFVATFEDGAWIPLPNVTDPERDVLIARVSHFSLVGWFWLKVEKLAAFVQAIQDSLNQITDPLHGFDAVPPICEPRLGPPRVVLQEGLPLFREPCAEGASNQPDDIRVRLVNDRHFTLVITPPLGASAVAVPADLSAALPALVGAAAGQAVILPSDEAVVRLQFSDTEPRQRIRAGPSNATVAIDVIQQALEVLTHGSSRARYAFDSAELLDVLVCVGAGYEYRSTFNSPQLLAATLGCFIRGGTAEALVRYFGLAVRLVPLVGVIVDLLLQLGSLFDQLDATARGFISLAFGYGNQWYLDVTYTPPPAPPAPPATPATPAPMPSATPLPTPAPTVVTVNPPSPPTNVVMYVTYSDVCPNGCQELTWAASGTTHYGFRVYMTHSGEGPEGGGCVTEPVLVATVPADATSYIPPEPPEIPPACWWVSAFNVGGESVLVPATYEGL